MRIHVACDHAAFDLKEALVSYLQEKEFEVIDHGSKKYDAEDDYPDTCIPCAEAVLKDEGSLGVVLGGSGNGEQMAANCVKGIRAALAWSLETAKLARMHNNAQIVAVGARMNEIPEALSIIDAFIAEPFTGEQRHQRRIDLMAKYEQDN